MARDFVIYSATQRICGIGSKGTPRKSISNPATITRLPSSASLLHTLIKSAEKNWASSIPITCASSTKSKISFTSLIRIEGRELKEEIDHCVILLNW